MCRRHFAVLASAAGASAYPSYLECAGDAATRLRAGGAAVIMGATPAACGGTGCAAALAAAADAASGATTLTVTLAAQAHFAVRVNDGAGELSSPDTGLASQCAGQMHTAGTAGAAAGTYRVVLTPAAAGGADPVFTVGVTSGYGVVHVVTHPPSAAPPAAPPAVAVDAPPPAPSRPAGAAPPAEAGFDSLPRWKEFEGSYRLHWGVDAAAGVVYLGFEAAVHSGPGGGWVGFGIAEQSAGAMAGADILLLQKGADGAAPGEWTVSDRHAMAGADGKPTFPVPDEQQDWVLDSAVEVGGTLWAKVHRQLDTRDGQDRHIYGGTLLTLWARGDSQIFTKHTDANRRMCNVEFVADPRYGMPDEDFGVAESMEKVTISMGNYLIPERETTYACRSARPKVLFNGEDAWLTRFEFINKNPDHNHHFIVHSCDHSHPGRAGDGKNLWTRYEHDTLECSSPQGNYDEGCTTAVYLWGVGAANWSLPSDVGFLVSDRQAHGIKAFVIEMHYDNPYNPPRSGVIDDSEVVVWYTRTPRKHEMGLLTVGDPLIAADPVPPLTVEKSYQFTCPGACTENFGHPITIIGSGLHMHSAGKRMYSVLHRETAWDKWEKGDTQVLNEAEFYAFDSQQVTKLPMIVLNPGDTLNTHCVMTNPGELPIPFGLGSGDEMCMEFVYYYPVVKRAKDGVPLNFCGFFTRYWEYPFLNGTICGVDAGRDSRGIEVDFEYCNPKPADVDTASCRELVWGRPGAQGLERSTPCRHEGRASSCKRTQHRSGAGAETDWRWVEDWARPPVEPLLPTSAGPRPRGTAAVAAAGVAAAALLSSAF